MGRPARGTERRLPPLLAAGPSPISGHRHPRHGHHGGPRPSHDRRTLSPPATSSSRPDRARGDQQPANGSVFATRHPTSHPGQPHQLAGARSSRRAQDPAAASADLPAARDQPHPVSGRGGRSPLAFRTMGLWQRFSTVFKAKASKAIDRMEDPRETLDYSYERQLEMLQKVKRGLVDVATSRKRLELQGEQLQAKAAKLFEQARRAMAADREDLAREALTRRAAIEPELEALKTQHAQLLAEETKLAEASKRLSAQVEAFRTRKDTIKASYTAAEAQTKVGEALSGLSAEMGDIGLAVQRAEDKTLAMQSRAGAIDELLASGALDDLSTPGDQIDAELGRVTSAARVDAELARLKAELPDGGPPTKELES